MGRKDRVKVLAANSLYKKLSTFLELCSECNIPWTIENPTNSMLWSLLCFEQLLQLGHFAHCEACAFGSSRNKKTSFLSSEAGISRMAVLCPGCSEHEPWGTDDRGMFNTAKEAQYPQPMCAALCDVMDQASAARQLRPGAARNVLVRAHRQPRGRLRPQLISEYSEVVTRALPAIPALDGRCITVDVGPVPSGSKLLRSEKKGDEIFLCVFGVYRSPIQFLHEARRLWHPFDDLVQLPDCLIKAIFEQLIHSPLELSKLRIQRLRQWKQWSAELEQRDGELKGRLHDGVRSIIWRKNLGLLERMVQHVQWPDESFLAEFSAGFRIVLSVGALGESDLMEAASTIKQEILEKISCEAPAEYAEELVAITMGKAEKGWVEGPFTPSQMDERFGVDSWIPVRRFGVRQGAKLRPIDDLSENYVNASFTSAEQVVLQAMDHLIWTMNLLTHCFAAAGTVEFTLSTGELLKDEVHSDWVRQGANLQVTSIDLKSAYRQLALSPLDYNKAVITLKNPAGNKLECYVTKAAFRGLRQVFCIF